MAGKWTYHRFDNWYKLCKFLDDLPIDYADSAKIVFDGECYFVFCQEL